MAKFTVSLKIENIGPHFGTNIINETKEVESNKAIFYAVNGTGKSFISRSFRLAELPPHLCDDLLTLGQSTAKFTFAITTDLDSKEVSVNLERGKIPSITNTSNLIFHVFNSDFVEDNIKPNHYTPDGNIDGYILGKTQIDLSEEKAKESALTVEIKDLERIIDNEISGAKQELHNKGVTSNTTELSLFTKENLKNPPPMNGVGTFADILTQLDKLSRVPESLDDIQQIRLDINTDFFGSVTTILTTSYPPSTWDEEFVKYYKENKSFIEHGLEKVNSGVLTCPFCKRTFDEDALKLIESYNEYKGNRESQTIAELYSYQKKFHTLLDNLKCYNQQVIKAKKQLGQIKEYYPSLLDYNLCEIEISEPTEQIFDSISSLIEKKIDDLTFSCEEITEYLKLLKLYFDSAKHTDGNNRSIIDAANRTKNSTKAERLILRRKLCKAKFSECSSALKVSFDKQELKLKELQDLRQSIREKEEQCKISKKEKVYSTLTATLDLFFNGKYTIDKDTFQIRFLGNTIGQQASHILSDGEKSIVAYCYYLATTHLLIERESDYDKLFFIIDDPISSMDFHYVYVVAQSIRDIKSTFNITTHERIWVFTHNLEFFSIVTRNHILNTAYSLKPGKIETINAKLLMPYESHLSDIVKISRKEIAPNHTTANSIRHVLETICKFEFPDKGIENYIAENPILSTDACIFSICQDLSHGGIRTQPPYTEDVLIHACDTVVAFMVEKYSGQIDAIK